MHAAAPDETTQQLERINRDLIQAARNGGGLSRPGTTAAQTAPHAPPDRQGPEPIAVIGLAGVLPQCASVRAFWQALDTDRSLIETIPDTRFDWRTLASGDTATSCRWGGFIPNPRAFDPLFFGILPADAELMDPRLRLLLMTVYQTLEDAGYAPDRFKQSRTGVFVALEDNDYRHLLAQRGLTGQAPDQSACLLPNHISYHFDFRGPSEAIDTMCSGAAVALHRAVSGLRLGDMDTAVVAAANVILRPEPFLSLARLGHLSPEPTVRSFGAEAAGHLRAEGAVSLLLKPLSSAEADGDHIYALIRNTAVNYNGRGGTSMAAPNPAAHADVVRDCYHGAGIDIRRVGYIEAQGMGNPVADLAEWRAYNRALRDLAKAQGVDLPAGNCRIGTLKPMTGHMEAVSALGALLKIIRTFQTGTAHKILDLAAAHPDLDQADTPCRLLRETETWPAGPLPRLAGLHAYGTGGNNAHILLEEYRPPTRQTPAASSWLAPLSASGSTSLRRRIRDLRHFLATETAVNPADLAFTLQAGRTAMEQRAAFVAESRGALIHQLDQYLAGNAAVCATAESSQRWHQAAPADAADRDEHVRRLPLPVFAFETQDFWLDQVTPGKANPTTQTGTSAGKVREILAAMLAETLRLPPEKLKHDKHLHEYGIDSLKGTDLIRALEKTFGCRIFGRDLLAHPSMNDLAAFIAAQTANGEAASRPDQPKAAVLLQRVPVSVNQRGLWLLQKLHPTMTAYNFPLGLRLFHPIDPDRFRQALQDVLRRHPILSGHFCEDGGQLLQKANPDAIVPFEQKDISALDSAQVDALLREHTRRPFDLAVGPLLRCSLLKRGPNEWIVLLVLHHIVTDGFSIPTLYTTLLDAYQQRTHGETPVSTPAAGRHFAAYVAWEQKMLAGPQGDALRAWWRRQLPNPWPTLHLPSDQPRRETPSFEGRVHQVTLAPTQSQALCRFARTHRINLAPLFLALFKTLLYRTTGQTDVIVGMPVRARPEGFDDTIGYFTNLLPIRVNTLAGQTFSAVMQRTQLAVLDALDHEALPFPEIVRDQAAERGDLMPLCQVLFEYQNFFSKDDLDQLQSRYPDMPLEFMADRHQEGEAELTLEVVRVNEGFLLNIKYDPSLFTATRIQDLSSRYLNLAEAIVADPNRRLETLPLLSPQERKQRDAWNATEVAYPKDRCFHELFAEQAKRTPNAPALICGDIERTYADLNRRSDQLAGYLQTLGVQAGTRVAVCIGRSEHVLVALLAVLKAGGAYVPLDPEFPEKRLTYMLEDSDALMVLTDSRRRGKVTHLLQTQIPVLALDKEWPLITAADRPVAPTLHGSDHLAYIIYTSGSSGKPKGVMIPHRALTNFLTAMAPNPGLRPNDRLLAVTTVSFDIAGLELFLPLISGALCMLCPEGIAADAAQLKQEIQRRRPTIMQATPTTWAMLFHAGWRNEEQVRVLCGGEPLPESLRQRFTATGSAVWNVYGPTETTIWSTIATLTETGPIHIGTPLANTEIYILGRHLAEMPAGSPGELCIAGDGLADGYHNRPDLTADRFVPHPFRAGQRLYRTGDLARRLPDGSLEHLGRMDFQVKVRGYRIEPAEIEARLSRHPGVRECVVVARTDQGGDHLVAWYLPAEPAPEARDLAHHLAADLPGYMVPSLFLPLDRFPLTNNGKIDRKTLMQRPLVVPGAPPPPAADRPLVQAVLTHWNAVLPVPVTSTTAGFFELGGDSYRAVVLAERISKAFAITFTTTDLFRHTSVDAMARHIAAGQGEPRQAQPIAVHAVEPAGEPAPTPEQDGVAIIGIACQFPDADDHHAFWRNLRTGHNSARFLTPETLRAAGVAETLINDPAYVPLQQTIADKYRFDNDFFRISHKNARAMDPQLRRLLQAAWAAVEDAGYVAEALADTGVYISAGNSFYQAPLYRGSVDLYDPDAYVAWVLAQPGAFATMIAYQLNLRGPAFAVHANCSSSLVGLHTAWQSLQQGEIRQALVGAASLMPFNQTGYRHRADLNFAADGRCKAFDASADGMVGGEGVAMVLLKRTADALADGDHIYARLRGIAVNNDGRDKAGFYAPSIAGQAAVIRKALAGSGVDPAEIDYVEAHGTGTKLGDPIEIAALTEAWGQVQPGRCGIGSVKSNIGHLDTAAGLAGLIKVAMSLSHAELAPTLHVTEPNPAINFAASPFYLVTHNQPWPKRNHPRRAALSSFGLGGTNTHAILEAAPATGSVKAAGGPYLIVLSAADSQRLRVQTARLRDALATKGDDDLAAVAYTLQVGRRAMATRLALVVNDLATLRDKLDAFLTHGRAPGLFLGEASGDQNTVPAAVVREGNREIAAQRWVEGAALDWSVLWPEPRPRRLSLPTYPFAGEIFDLAPPAAESQAATAPHHPLLHRQKEGDKGYRSRFTGSEPFFADHVVDKQPVLPGVAYLEMARFAAQHALAASRLTLRNLVWVRPLAVTNEPIDVSLELIADGAGRYRYRVNSEQTDGSALLHGQGLIEPSTKVTLPEAYDPALLQQQTRHQRFDAETCYRRFAAFGIDYGTSHRALEWVATDAAEPTRLLAKLHLPSLGDSRFVLHPGMLDAAVQASIGFVFGSGESGLTLPYALREVSLFHPCSTDMWAILQRRGDAQDAPMDITLCDADGRVCVVMNGLVNRPVAAASKTTAAGAQLHLKVPVWDAVKPERKAEATANPILIGASARRRRELTARFPNLTVAEAATFQAPVDPAGAAPMHLIWMAPAAASHREEKRPEAAEHGILQLFRIVKKLLAAGFDTRACELTLITSNAVPVFPNQPIDPTGAAVHGFAGAMAHEFAHWTVRLLDVAPAAPLPQDLTRIQPEPRGATLAHRSVGHNGQWFRQQLLPIRAWDRAGDVAVRQGGVYVVIGGAGGIGAAWSRRAAERYAATVYWLGRRPIDESIRERIEAATVGNLVPQYIQADASDPEAMAQALATIHARHPRIDGLIQAALVLDDGSLTNLDETRFLKVLKSRVHASVHAARLCQPQDFLLFLSSMTAFDRGAGQSNYAAGCTFMDSYAHHLAQTPGLLPPSCRVCVINWGFWGSIGAVATPAYRTHMEQAGFGSIEPEDGLPLMDHLPNAAFHQLAVTKTIGRQPAPLAFLQQHAQTVPALLHQITVPEPTDLPSPPVAAFNRDLLQLLWAVLAPRCRGAAFQPADLVKGDDATLIRWCAESCRLLAEAGFLAAKGTGYAVNTEPAPNAWQTWRQHESRWCADPTLAPQVPLVTFVMEALPAVLDGTQRAHEVLFPNASMARVEGVYKNNPVADTFNNVLGTALVAWFEQRLRNQTCTDCVRKAETSCDQVTPVRILEIGAGTGGTTAGLLPLLQPYTDYLEEYTYTDLSHAFLKHARAHYAPGRPWLKTRLFDVGKPLADQAFEPGSYDLIIATNVLHATADMRHTLRNAKAALKKNGALFLNEISNQVLFDHLTFGLLDGWWLYQDSALRLRGCPGLDPATWHDLLVQEGFHSVTFPAAVAHHLGQQIVLAESDGLVRQIQPAAEPIATPTLTAPAVVTQAAATGREDQLAAIIRESLAAALDTPPALIHDTRSFADLGVDSISAVGIINHINERCGLLLPTTTLFDFPNLDQLTEFLLTEHQPLLSTAQGADQTQADVDDNRRRAGIRACLADSLAMPQQKIRDDRAFSEYGVDSILAVELINRINQTFDVLLQTTVLFDHNTVDRLSDHLEKMQAGPAQTAQPVLAPSPSPSQAQPVPNEAGRYRHWQLRGPGEIDDLVLTSSALEPLTADAVRIRVHAFSLNFADWLCVRGLYPNMPPYPFTPGDEAAGVVEAVGSAVTRFQVGDAVVCLTPACHAEVVTCPQDRVYPKPSSLSFEEACSLPMVALTMLHAFRKADVQPGERVLIQTAAGGIGLVAVQLAQHAGAEIFATAGSAAKLDYLRGLGVAHGINYRETDFEQEIQRLTHGEGVDVVINTLAGDAVQKGLNLLRAGGRYIEIAMAALKSARAVDLSVLNRNQTFISIDLGLLRQQQPERIRRDWETMNDLLAQGVLRPTISHRFPFAAYRDAYRALAQRTTIGKVVVQVAATAPPKDTQPRKAPGEKATSSTREPIAIIGVSARFAHSPDLDAFWRNLAAGRHLVDEVSRWDLGAKEGDKGRCRFGSFLEDYAHFDAAFFNITEEEAVYMDPQQRLFLEEAWHALENAGHCGEAIRGSRCSVYVGAIRGDYPNLFTETPPAHAFWGNEASVIPARISYLLDLHGPAVAVDTACSSSLSAIHYACADLWSGLAETAVAGGVFVQPTPEFYRASDDAGMLSPSGRCYSFDARADGFVPGEGVGALVLKPLSAAQADGDHIHGVILGCGVNQDGGTNGLTAPGARSQERLLRQVYQQFQIDPEQITMVDAHGTGTRLGDAIEFEALTRAFDSDKTGFCALGSVKSNIGHAATASGLSGLVKVLLALRHQQIPPSLNFQSSPLPLQDSPFFINTHLRPWSVPTGQHRIGAVSSFGFSGTNAHVVLAEAPTVSRHHAPQSAWLITLSARSDEQLQTRVDDLIRHLGDGADHDLGNISFTLLTGRTHHHHRLACLAGSLADLLAALTTWRDKGVDPRVAVRALPEGRAASKTLREAGNRLIETFPTATEPAALLRQIRDYYLQGCRLNYGDLFGTGFTRVPLPTYPFARKQFLPETTPLTEIKTAPAQQVQEQEQDQDTHIEMVRAWVAEHLNKPAATLDPTLSFFQLGMDSYGLNALADRLAQHLGRFPTTLFFEYICIADLAAYLADQHPDLSFTPSTAAPSVRPQPNAAGRAPAVQPATADIAVIGISGAFPQAENLAAFWDNILAGTDCVTPVPENRFPVDAAQPHWVGGFLSDIDHFDPLFFGISPREAKLLDPQQRLLLRHVWQALEDAAVAPDQLRRRPTGIFTALAACEAYEQQACLAAGEHAGLAVQGAAALPNRIAQLLDVCGPAANVESACTSSLLALHHAVQAIQSGSCDQAVVACAHLILTADGFIENERLGNLSPSGRVHSFQAEADGFVRSEGVGVVLLKRLDAAEADGDRIQAVIKGSGVAAGGRAMSLTAPNAKGMRLAVQNALRASQDAVEVDYIEAHGTGTVLGDSIEISALRDGYQAHGRRDSANPIHVGCVKPLIGNSEIAAGMAEFLKVVLALRHQVLPGIPAFREPHQQIDLRAPFQMTGANQPWPQGRDQAGRPRPRRAGVNSYGIAGTNAHLLVEEYAPAPRSRPVPDGAHLIVLSAPSEERLRVAAAQLLTWLEQPDQTEAQGFCLADLAYTLQVGRQAMTHRLALVVADTSALTAGLARWLAGNADATTYQADLDMSAAAPSGAKSAAATHDAAELAAHWVHGGAVDWTSNRTHLRRIKAPGYPFRTERYPIQVNPVRTQAVAPAKPAPDHNEDAGDWLRQTVAAILDLTPAQIPPRKPLFQLGFTSLGALSLKTALEQRTGTLTSLAAINIYNSLEELVESLAVAGTAPPQKPTAVVPEIQPDPAARFQPFPLNDIQESFLLGRNLGLEEDRVGCHIYTELAFAELDIYRLNQAWQSLIDHHDMLRVVIHNDGTQQVQPQARYRFRVGDLRHHGASERAARLTKVRERMAHQVYQVNQWPLFEIRVSLCPEHTVVHFSMDELVFDAAAMDLLFHQWQLRYQDLAAALPQTEVSFRDYVLALKRFEQTPRYRDDLAYHLEARRRQPLPYGPALPLRAHLEKQGNRFSHLEAALSAETWHALKQNAAARLVSPSALVLGVFTGVLQAWCGPEPFSLIMTRANRETIHPDLPRVVGPFISTSIHITPAQSAVDQLVRATQTHLTEDLDHGSVGGIRLLRELRRRRLIDKRHFLPVVFTSLLGHPTLPADAGFRNEITYFQTQTPQVYLDHQVREQDDQLIIRFDVIKDYFEPGFIDAFFQHYRAVLTDLAAEAHWDRVIEAPPRNRAQPGDAPNRSRDLTPFGLTDQQQAYAFGRSQFGAGTNTQVYTSYDADFLDVPRLERAWAQVLAVHDMLTTRILSDGTAQPLSHAEYPIPVRDLRHLSEPARQTALADIETAMMTRICPLDEWPYFEVRVSRLPDRWRIHLTIDMMIADGPSIDLILNDWFAFYRRPDRFMPPPAYSFRDYIAAQTAFRSSDAFRAGQAYWKRRFATMPTGPRFPGQPDGSTATPHRLSASIDGWSTLREAAERLSVSPGMILLTAYTDVLAAHAVEHPFTVVIPCWQRPPLHPAVNEVVGDFTAMSWLVVDTPHGNFEARVRATHAAVQQDLAHLRVSGLAALRRVAAKRDIAFPVVFTDLSIHPGPDLPDGFRPGRSLSRTPQVQLDNISSEHGDRLDIAWDVHPNQLPMDLVTHMFAAYRDQVHDLIRDPAAWLRAIQPSQASDDGTAAVAGKLESAE